MEKSSPDVMGGGRRPWRVGNQIDAEIGGRSFGGSLELALDGGREGGGRPGGPDEEDEEDEGAGCISISSRMRN